MKNIILTSGPKGAGKSTYSKKFIERYPETQYISRDDLLMELFNKTTTNPDTSESTYAHMKLLGRIKEKLDEQTEGLELIVDYWNGYPHERKKLIKEFKELGANQVICWKFITPNSIAADWFFKKEDSYGYLDGYLADYKLYHKKSQNIESEGFDKVVYINPAQLVLDLK